MTDRFGKLARCALILAGLAIALVLAEGAVRWFGLSKTFQSYYHPENVRYREIFQRYPDRKELSYDLVPGKEVTIKGVRFRINGSGFRDREFSGPKPPGTLRIACLGDSVTFGYDLSHGETYPQHLEKALRASGHKVETMNFGALHFDLPENIGVFYRKSLPFEPDVVILQFGLNDIDRGKGDFGAEAAMRRQHNGASALDIKSMLRSSALYLFVAERYNHVMGSMGSRRQIIKDFQTQAEDWEWVKGLLTPFFADLRARKIKVVLAYFPYDFQIYSPMPEVREPQRILREYARRQRVRFVDLTDGLRRADSVLRPVFLDDAHLSAWGARVAAKVLKEKLEPLLAPALTRTTAK